MKKISIMILIMSFSMIGCGDNITSPNNELDNVKIENNVGTIENKEPEILKIEETIETKTIYEYLEKYAHDNIEIETIKVNDKNILKIGFTYLDETSSYIEEYQYILNIAKDIKDFKSLDEISVFIWGNIEDKYGNSDKGLIHSFEYSRETIEKINWDNISLDKFIKLAENVFTLNKELLN